MRLALLGGEPLQVASQRVFLRETRRCIPAAVEDRQQNPIVQPRAGEAALIATLRRDCVQRCKSSPAGPRLKLCASCWCRTCQRKASIQSVESTRMLAALNSAVASRAGVAID